MTPDDARRAIEQRLVDNWVSTDIDINANVPFSAPPLDASYIKLDILRDDRERLNIGTDKPVVHQHGTIVIRIYTPPEAGTRLGIDYGNTLAELFREVKFGGVKTRQPNVKSAGEFQKRWQTNMLVSFQWESDT